MFFVQRDFQVQKNIKKYIKFELGGVKKMLEDSCIKLILQLVDEEKIDRNKLRNALGTNITKRQEMREWFYQFYMNYGIENITKEKFEISQCPFTDEEIEEASKNNEVILCVPKGVTKKQFGDMFRIDSWALTDQLVGETVEIEDFWFKTKKTMHPEYIRKTGIDMTYFIDNNNLVHFTLERYLVFLEVVKRLTGEYPDQEYWIWITRGRYDRSGMLMAGFDRLKRFNVHGWMPQFDAGYLGARYGELPNCKR